MTPMPPRGSSQGGLRQYNERVVLQALRLHGPLPAAELARLTQLTAQTISMITRRLLDDGLLRKGEPLRGRVGQPSVPLSLAPDGAFALGIKVGRRSLDLLLLDFAGTVLERWRVDHHFPDPDRLLPDITTHVAAVRRRLGKGRRDRLQGIGIAQPLQLSSWHELLGADAAVAAKWDRVDLRAEVEARTGVTTHLLKDTAAACLAELVVGRGQGLRSYLYVFVDTFVGGGLVVDHQLHGGHHGNAGAVGSLPLVCSGHDGGPPAQLLSVASLVTLEQAWRRAGLADSAATDGRALSGAWAAITRQWVDEAAAGLALAADSAACLLDLDAVVIDGAFSPELRDALLNATQQALSRHDGRGATRPSLVSGSLGADAGALGGAWLPLVVNFAPDRALFLKADRA